MTPADIERIKDLLPTSLGSDEVRTHFAQDILRRSVFSARMESARYLAKIREVATAMLEGRISQADARNTLEGLLDQMGHSMAAPGGLTNPASIRRLNLILETQTQMAASVAQLEEQTPDVVAMWPAWELMRLEDRDAPRPDWAARWNLAGESVGWDGALPTHVGGRMVALKSSPIWQALGQGVGGFRDTLGNPYPPFAYSSGMGWEDLGRDECEALGLIKPGAKIDNPQSSISLAPDIAKLREAAERYGFDFEKGLI